MALIEVFHVVASQVPIDATNATDIPQGSLVTLDANGNAIIADTAAVADIAVMGIAGDSRSQGTTSFTPESGAPLSRNPTTSLTGALVLGAYGDAQRFTQNRVADNFNEVLASGKMTVYHGGGEFWTDQYELNTDAGAATVLSPGELLYASDNTADANSNGGKFTDDATGTKREVGMVITSPTGYPSGVPGTGPNAVGFSALPEGGNSISWGNFLHIKLSI